MPNLLNQPIFLTDTKSRKKVRFEPLTPGKLKMYSCGPTVYGFIHVGNLRAGLTADLFYRFFKYFGYDVTYVRNYTDVDDKIIKKVLEEKTTLKELTGRYIQEVEKDYALAGMLEPTHKTLVTDHMPEIISMIERILENKKAYQTDDGEVLFSIDAFPTYGELSGKSLEDLEAGHRVEVNPKKKNPFDFSLWKPAKENEQGESGDLVWDSPWGKGRPGWHIECSAMASKWLGEQMDLHHGGEDLIFPHHENEVAQTEAATGASPSVRYWVHNAFLTMSKEKMSKSLGNVVHARDFLAMYSGEVARYLFLSVHYRSGFDFSGEAVDQAVTSLERIYEAKKLAEEVLAKKITVPDQRAEQVWGGFMIDTDRARKAIREHYANDLNTPAALSEVFTLIREWNRCSAEPNALNTPVALLAAKELMGVIEEEIGSVIGVGRLGSESALKKLQEIRMIRQQNQGKTVLSDEAIEALILERKEARATKNFARSDEIRDELLDKGVEIKDSPQGTTWIRAK